MCFYSQCCSVHLLLVLQVLVSLFQSHIQNESWHPQIITLFKSCLLATYFFIHFHLFTSVWVLGFYFIGVCCCFLCQITLTDSRRLLRPKLLEHLVLYLHDLIHSCRYKYRLGDTKMGNSMPSLDRLACIMGINHSLLSSRTGCESSVCISERRMLQFSLQSEAVVLIQAAEWY